MKAFLDKEFPDDMQRDPKTALQSEEAFEEFEEIWAKQKKLCEKYKDLVAQW